MGRLKDSVRAVSPSVLCVWEGGEAGGSSSADLGELEAGPVDPAASLLLEFPICTPVIPCSSLLLFLNLLLVKWAPKCWLPASVGAWCKTPFPRN